jgi:hypothetical protein
VTHLLIKLDWLVGSFPRTGENYRPSPGPGPFRASHCPSGGPPTRGHRGPPPWPLTPRGPRLQGPRPWAHWPGPWPRRRSRSFPREVPPGGVSRGTPGSRETPEVPLWNRGSAVSLVTPEGPTLGNRSAGRNETQRKKKFSK